MLCSGKWNLDIDCDYNIQRHSKCFIIFLLCWNLPVYKACHVVSQVKKET